MSALPHQLLVAHLKRKQRSHPRYSIRALARDLKVNSSYLSAVFSGKKPVPQKRLKEIASRLEIDDLALKILTHAIARLKSSFHEIALVGANQSEVQNTSDYIQKFHEASRADLKLWNKWYNVAILDLSTCSGFKVDPEWIAKRCNIRVSEARQSLQFLLDEGYLVLKDGRAEKAHLHLRMPTTASGETVRSFHEQLMLRAIKTMHSKTDIESYKLRLITGAMVATNSEQISKAREILQAAMVQVAEVLLQGEATEVYQLGVQLFPLSDKI